MTGTQYTRAALLATAWLCACASLPPPRTQIGRAEAAVASAQNERAGTYAPVELQRARSQLEGAKEAVRQGQHGAALRLAEQAQVDAELAELQAARERAKQSAAEMSKTVDALKEEIDR